MKKLLTAILLISMFFTLLVPMSYAQEQEDRYVPEETFTREELLAMDPELDSDGDGLSDVIELVYGSNRYDADTDGDGVTDYTEFCITCTDVLVPDGQIDTDGDGLTNAEETVYETNPDDLDTDNDNLGDYEEIMVLHTDPLVKNNSAKLAATDVMSPVFLGNSATDINPLAIGPDIGIDNPGGGQGGASVYNTTLTTKYGTSNVSYKFLSNTWFFANNEVYNRDLAVTSSLLSAIAYDESFLGNTSTSSLTPETAVKDWFDLHGFTDYACYDLDYDAVTNPTGRTDQHVSEMFIANKAITSGSITKRLICIVIRGTNGTLDEWQSNFDIGTTVNYSSFGEWRNQNNHMGFDITVYRLGLKLNSYLSTNNLEDSDVVYWITGHSRGGALANILAAKQAEYGEEVFAYTFAAPATTRQSNAKTSSTYKCIFNIINEDDFVPLLPLDDWGFMRYGEDKPDSIEQNYSAAWYDLLNGQEAYTCSTANRNATMASLLGISTTRNNCYVFRDDSSGYHDTLFPTQADAFIGGDAHVSLYTPNMAGTYKVEYFEDEFGDYVFRVHQQPAFLMQLLAAKQGGAVTILGFAAISVAEYLSDAKNQLISYALSNGMEEPHYTESYYLLANKIT